MGLHSEQREHIDTVIEHTSQAGSLAGCSQSSEIITRSWKRCVEEYGLDPTRPQPARIVTTQTLLEHQDQVDEFLNVARAGVEQLYAHISQLDYVVLLTDKRGIAVEYLGNWAHERELRLAGLYLGADWNERHAGTCGVGTCIQERQALTCHRSDHFDASHIGLTCTSAPITDPQGELLAVLDVSALRSPRSRQSQNFAFQFVTLYARMIENAYFLRRYRDSHIFRYDVSREFVQVNGRYLLAVDEDGTILAANTCARDFLNRHHPDYARNLQQGCLKIFDIFDCELRDIWSIPLATDDQVRAFRTHRWNEIYFATLIEPKKHAPLSEAAKNLPKTEPIPALDELGADDPSMRKTIARAKHLLNEDINVLIIGETGTGKERLARAMHDSSERAAQPFVALNCAAIPESLIESELFGYKPGTFTGARNKGMKGLIQQSDGGTLFLDEIGDMPLHLQTRLLRVLAEKEILPLGAEKPVPVKLRVIAATHRHIRQLVTEGAFRQDLYYRLNGAILHLPPLRERADKQYLIRRVFEAVSKGRDRHVMIRGDAMSALLSYDWPGNIRELMNTLSYALATCEGNEITANDLPDECVSQASRPPSQGPSHIDEQPTPALSSEAQTLYQALRDQKWNVSAVSKRLGLSRPTIYRRMKKHGIVPPNLRD